MIEEEVQERFEKAFECCMIKGDCSDCPYRENSWCQELIKRDGEKHEHI